MAFIITISNNNDNGCWTDTIFATWVVVEKHIMSKLKAITLACVTSRSFNVVNLAQNSIICQIEQNIGSVVSGRFTFPIKQTIINVPCLRFSAEVCYSCLGKIGRAACGKPIGPASFVG